MSSSSVADGSDTEFKAVALISPDLKTTDAAVLSQRNAHRVEDFFRRLGDTIAAEVGDDQDDARARLEQVALAQLAAFDPSAHITHADLVDHVLNAENLCAQLDLDAKFAEPPVSLYRGRNFDISALIWLDGTTTIHQHSFSGAFHVLAGSSIHSRYRFDAPHATALQQRAIAGDLRLLDIEVLKAGDTRPITRGSAMIHSLFHMSRPSVTIVIRTTGDDYSREIQYDYRWPGLAFNPFHDHAPTIRKQQYLRMLRALDADAAFARLRQVLAGADLYLASVLITEQTLFSGDPAQAHTLVTHCGALSADERLLVARSAHNALLSRTIIRCRRTLHDPGHRFLLALLLNVFDRRELLRLVARESGAADPVDQIIVWIGEMTGHTDRFPNLIGLDFRRTELRMLDRMLRGEGFEGILAHFRELHGSETVADQRNDLSALYSALKECALFHHIFAALPD